MSNLESRKKNAEQTVHNIMLGDMKLGITGLVKLTSKDTVLFLDKWTRVENLHDLFHVILRITKN